MRFRSGRCFDAVLILCVLFVSSAVADEIKVSPGKGTISAAVIEASAGDTLVLEAGRYEDSVDLPEGVTLRGAGPDKTIFISTGYTAVNCRGNNVTISGIEFQSGEETTIGINTSGPVRVERCRFVDFDEAIALVQSPLSDVVHCEFRDCGVGVRAIAEACPTIWGCIFEGGRMGIFVSEGAPYIRNNIFRDLDEGIRVVQGRGSMTAIIRNNLFIECEQSGIQVVSNQAFFSPSVRNCYFQECGSAVIAEAKMFSTVSHCAFKDVTDPAFRNAEGLSEGDSAKLFKADDDVELTSDWVIIKGGLPAFSDAGIRLCDEAEGTKGRIGLTLEGKALGCSPAKEVELPPVRFVGPVYIANAVSEEYQYMRLMRIPRGQQSLTMKNGRAFDVHSAAGGKETAFDISRFFGEMGLRP